MASYFPLRSSHFCNAKAVRSNDGLNITTKIKVIEQERKPLANKFLQRQLLFGHASAHQAPSVQRLPGGLSSTSSWAADSDKNIVEENYYLSKKTSSNDRKFNRVNCLVWILHESAGSFSAAIKDIGLARTGPPVAMAWIGVDVHSWNKKISYQVAVYALLLAVTEVELFLSQNRSNNPSPVLNILSPKMNFLGDLLESQLNVRNPELVEWFRMVVLPHITGSFMPLIKKWTMEYAGSGVAGTIMAMTCCAAVRKLGSERISCYVFSNSIEDALFELMSATKSLVSLHKLHQLSTEAGFEDDFLSHFGSKILPNKNVEDIEFWIELVQRKLFRAFHRESVVNKTRIISKMVQENSLTTLALFAYLGRETRLFLLRHGIKDLDKQIKDFVNYLECGILVLYPEFSTLSEYQLIMEVILDEIGWLDFYAAYNNHLCQEKRSKSPPTQAEKEITLRAVFTVCYDVILGYAHSSNSRRQTLGADLLDFLLKSQALLSACLEDYWAAYDGTIDLQNLVEKIGPESANSLLINGSKITLIVDTQQRPTEMKKMEKHIQGPLQDQTRSSPETQAGTPVDAGLTPTKSLQQSFLRKYTQDLVAASVDVWMGTQLLFVDISQSLRILKKQLNGHNITKREKRKMQRTVSDIATLIPIAILMLLPVSAVGHAAMFSAIKKYMPSLIPSPYSDERLDLVKQLKRTKKIKVQHISNEGSGF